MKIEKVPKLVANLSHKEENLIHTRNLKQALNHGLVLLILTKVQRVIEFDQKTWLKPYTDMNTEPRKNVKNDFEKVFFKLMSNTVFGKTNRNFRKDSDINLVSESNYHRTKIIFLVIYHQ